MSDRWRTPPSKHKEQFQGRFGFYSDERWVYPIPLDNDTVWTNSGGLNADPSINWTGHGPLLEKDEQLTRFKLAFRGNSTQTNNFRIRLYHQYGPWENGTWDSTGETTRTLIHEEPSLYVNSSTDWKRIEIPLSYTVPEDGFFLFYAKPNGSVSSTRYVYVSGLLESVS